MEVDGILEKFDGEWAATPATKLDLYMIARLLQNYTLLRVRELADVSLSKGDERTQITERIARLEDDIDRMLTTFIAPGEGEME